MMKDPKQFKRWRLILGSESNVTLESYSGGGLALDPDELIMDEALAAIYDRTAGDEFSAGPGQGGARRMAGKGSSTLRLAKWLADIRTFFPVDVVSVIQSDAIERRGLKQLLLEPEVLKNVQPNLELVATLMSLKGKIPERTRETARQVIKAVVEEINKRLENDLRKAVTGALNRRKHSSTPSAFSIDWKYTISRNLKNYSKEYGKIIPERIFFFDRAQKTNQWHVILDLDQSGSMAESVIYGSVAGGIFAGMAALKTRIVAFDTEVADLTGQYGNDPVDILFGIQLGGGTDINKSVSYCQQFITDPAKTLFILISDLYEGGNQAALVRRMEEMHESGVKAICLLALSDRGVPAYNEGLARRFSHIGIPCFACTPGLLPDLLEGALKGRDLNELADSLRRTKRNKAKQI